MRIFVTSDIHGNKALIHLALKIMKREKLDALIIAGDIAPKAFYQLFKKDSGYEVSSSFPMKNELITKGNEYEIRKRLDMLGYIESSECTYELSDIQLQQTKKMREICDILKVADIPVFMLIGNDDHVPGLEWDKILEDYGIFNLNLRTHSFGKWQVTGFQHVLPTPWNTNNELPEEQLAVILRNTEKQVNRQTIFVTHGPPKNVLDRVANGLCAGSVSIRKLVENKQPIFHVFGHIHESFGQEKLGNTLCCNVSCLWYESILRGYIVDLNTKSIDRIEQKISMDDLIALE